MLSEDEELIKDQDFHLKQNFRFNYFSQKLHNIQISPVQPIMNNFHKAYICYLPFFLFTSIVSAQTIIPAGFGAMSVTQPSRETAVFTGVLNSTGGQNPTVKIRWGDEDRGTAVTPSTAWDNEVTVSTNQAAGTFSTTITIPNLEKVYYFRAIASNSGGTVVSRSLGVLLPSAPVGVANLQGRWNFDSENANDSSGTGRHGTAKKLFSPSEVSSMNLWLDAADASTITHSSNAVSQWNDKSGTSNHATQSTADNKPGTNTATLNGLNVIDFTGDFLVSPININRSSIPDLSIFAVFASKSTTGNGSLFGSDNGGWDRLALLNFDANSGNKWGVSNAGGTTPFESTRTPDTDYHILSIVLDTGVTNGSSVSLDGATSTSFTELAGSAGTNTTAIGAISPSGNFPMSAYLAEMIFVSSITSNSECKAVEGYLAHKWGLSGALASAHPYKLGAPTSASGTPTYITDTPFGSGKAIDLADGHVEVSTGESEDTFDGGAAFSVSAWVKGWPTESYAPFISKVPHSQSPLM